VRIKIGDNPDALVVPQPAVIEVQSEHMLVVLTHDNKATFRPVKVGDKVGTNWVITEGLKPGERVVVEGTQRIQTAIGQAPELAKEGIPVNPKPYVPPSSAGGGD
jgi:membrane fusion protein (multidrug efflux system)